MIADELLEECNRFLSRNVLPSNARDQLRNKIQAYLREFNPPPPQPKQVAMTGAVRETIMRRLNRIANDALTPIDQVGYFTTLYQLVRTNTAIAHVVKETIDGELTRHVYDLLKANQNLQLLAPELNR